MKKSSSKSLVPIAGIEHRIYLIRGCRVMLDSDLAELYGVSTKVLNQAVKRNRKRFPGDFMYELTKQEAANLRSQFVTLKPEGRGRHRKYLPYAFTEQGVSMLSSVLKSERAVLVNIAIMRAFVKMRQAMTLHKELEKKLKELERKVAKHDRKIQGILQAIYDLMNPPQPIQAIGFQSE